MPMDDGRKLFVVRTPRAARKAKQETIAPSPPSSENRQFPLCRCASKMPGPFRSLIVTLKHWDKGPTLTLRAEKLFESLFINLQAYCLSIF